jgi:hypothetical protein
MDFDDRKSCSCALRRRLPKDLHAASDVRTNIRRSPAPKFQTHHIFGVFLGRKASFLVTRGGYESLEKSRLPQNMLQRFDRRDAGPGQSA